jgi:hypothetical protein
MPLFPYLAGTREGDSYHARLALCLSRLSLQTLLVKVGINRDQLYKMQKMPLAMHSQLKGIVLRA